MGAGVAIPVEAIVTLRRRLSALPARHPERGPLLAQTADLYGVSRATLYRLLRGERRRHTARHRACGLKRDLGRLIGCTKACPELVEGAA